LAANPKEWLGHYFLATAYEGLGRRAEAIPEYQKAIAMSSDAQEAVAALGHAYALTGRRAEAENILHDLEQRTKHEYVSPYLIATVHAGLGDKDQAFVFLEKAYAEKSWDLPSQLQSDLRIDNLRSDPRFQDLSRRLNFPHERSLFR
jgi:tetratricopeptide (TPR) repeat protein